MNAQCVVTRLPRAGPAAVSSIAPVHTLVTQRAVAATAAIQSSSALLSTSRRVPCPPGISRTSSLPQSATVACGSTVMPLAQRTGPSRSAINTVSHASCCMKLAMVKTS